MLAQLTLAHRTVLGTRLVAGAAKPGTNSGNWNVPSSD
jgi:hypothetical protein